MPDEMFDPRWMHAIIPRAHWHFHRRLLERYGIVLGPGDYSAIMKAVSGGHAQLIERRSAKTAIYSVRLKSVKERIYLLVALNRRIITALPPGKRLNKLRRRLLQIPVTGPIIGIPIEKMEAWEEAQNNGFDLPLSEAEEIET